MCEICFLWIGSHFDFAVRWCEVCNQETFGAARKYSPPARISQEFSEFPTFPDPQAFSFPGLAPAHRKEKKSTWTPKNTILLSIK